MALFEDQFEAEFEKTTLEPEETPVLSDIEDDFIIDEGEPIKARNAGGL